MWTSALQHEKTMVFSKPLSDAAALVLPDAVDLVSAG